MNKELMETGKNLAAIEHEQIIVMIQEMRKANRLHQILIAIIIGLAIGFSVSVLIALWYMKKYHVLGYIGYAL